MRLMLGFALMALGIVGGVLMELRHGARERAFMLLLATGCTLGLGLPVALAWAFEAAFAANHPMPSASFLAACVWGAVGLACNCVSIPTLMRGQRSKEEHLFAGIVGWPAAILTFLAGAATALPP